MKAQGRRAVLAGMLAAAMALLGAQARSAAAQEMTKDQQKCVNAMNKSLQKMAATVGKDAQQCLKNFAKGKSGLLGPSGTAQGCLTADLKGKVQKARDKTAGDFTKKCGGNDKNGLPKTPPYGVSDADTVNQVAEDKELDLIVDLFGSDLDATLIPEAAGKDASKCQQAVLKSALKCQDTMMKEFNKCKKDGLKGKAGPPFAGAAEIASCIGQDPKGKIAKACDDPAKPDKIRKDIDKKCVAKGVDLAGAFPGCTTRDPEALHACVLDAVDDRACHAVCTADDLGFPCGSCQIGKHTCVEDTRAWCVGGPLDGQPCTDGLANTDCAPGGNCVALSRTDVYTRLVSHPAPPLFDVTQNAHIGYDCGVPDPVTGKATCLCTVDWTAPIDMGPLIGIACLTDFPVPGCGEGEVDCDGGSPMNQTQDIDHDIGDCGLTDDPNETDPNNLVGSSECAAACDAHCAGLGGGFHRFRSGCEGYCRFGATDGRRCRNDIDCFLEDPNSPSGFDLSRTGECVGGEPVAHGGRCQCECIEVGGAVSPPGTLWCTTGVRTVLEANAPCDEMDPTLVTLACTPRGSGTIHNTIHNADDIPGATVEIPVYTGTPITCEELFNDQLDGLSTRSNSSSLDSALGDMNQPIFDECL